MRNILRIDTSAQQERSLTRALGDIFEDRWQNLRPEDTWQRRDLALDPPVHVGSAWIAAAFTPEDRRSADQQDLLSASDRMIGNWRRPT